jgi:biopolymer transport protein ExbD
MAMSASSGGGVKAEPNVTPMIDVMLVLLIIFMIIIPTIISGFNAVPPQGINLTSHPEEEEDQVVGIDAENNYYLNKKLIPNALLEDSLTRIYTARTIDKILYIKAHKDLEYGKVQDVMDIAAKAGVRVTGMISDQEKNTVSTVAGDLGTPATATPPPDDGGGD